MFNLRSTLIILSCCAIVLVRRDVTSFMMNNNHVQSRQHPRHQRTLENNFELFFEEAELLKLEQQQQQQQQHDDSGSALLFPTAYNMACLSSFIYRYATLRSKGNSKLKNALQLPITSDDLANRISENWDQVSPLLFDSTKEKQADEQFLLQTLEALQNQKLEWIRFHGEEESDVPAKSNNKKNAKGEMVYGIVLNHTTKQCIVVFCGSHNNYDLVQDGKIPMARRNNPVLPLRSAFGDIFLHQGFEEYLFDHKDGNQLFAILHDVYPYIQGSAGGEGRGYELCFTGHSLGGALATLVGFYAASDHRNLYTRTSNKTSKPIQIYTFGSPRVGDKSFQTAFEYLERNGKLRHARFHNRMDLVARAPTHAAPTFVKRYAHVGMDITLRSDKNTASSKSGVTPDKDDEIVMSTIRYSPTIQEEDEAMRSLFTTTSTGSSKSQSSSRASAFQSSSAIFAELSSRLSSSTKSKDRGLSTASNLPSAVGKLIHHDMSTYAKRINAIILQYEKDAELSREKKTHTTLSSLYENMKERDK